MTAPFIAMAVGAKTKKPKVAQATTNNFKSITGGKILSLTDLHGHPLRLRFMRNHLNFSLLRKWVTVLKI